MSAGALGVGDGEGQDAAGFEPARDGGEQQVRGDQVDGAEHGVDGVEGVAGGVQVMDGVAGDEVDAGDVPVVGTGTADL